MVRHLARVLFGLTLVAAAGCDGRLTELVGDGTTAGTGPHSMPATTGGLPDDGNAIPAGTPTYYADVKPILDASCSGCHSAGNLGPFTLTSYSDAQAHLAGIDSAVSSGTMPPWPAGPNCNTYKYSSALTDAQRATVLAWTAAGGPAGDPASATTAAPVATGTMPRVDATLQIKAPYTIVKPPDEYRCFVLDWPATTMKYVTGFRVHADQKSVVHHAIIMIANPDEVATLAKKDGADGRPGYDCYGTFGTTSIIPHWLGFWAPGNNGAVFSDDEHTGLPVQPGSKIVVQMHYHWEGDIKAAPADQSAVDVMWKDTVAKPGAAVPVLKLSWYLAPTTMKIAAGDPDAVQSGGLSVNTIWKTFSGGQPAASSYTLYSAGIHMHVRGSKATLSLASGSKSQCLVDIPHYSFHWQDTYTLANPITLAPSDNINITCHWDNSAAGQPVINGTKAPVQAITWGEGTNDEMCLGIVYLAPS